MDPRVAHYIDHLQERAGTARDVLDVAECVGALLDLWAWPRPPIAGSRGALDPGLPGRALNRGLWTLIEHMAVNPNTATTWWA